MAARPRTSVIESGRGLSIDTTELKWLAKAMRDAGRASTREFRGGLRGVGEIIAADARQRAGTWSTSIPPTIKVRIASTTVEIRGGDAVKPLARLAETGNLRKGRSQRWAAPNQKFKHPIWGTWVTGQGFQPTRPFLRPAVMHKNPEAMAALGTVFLKALDQVGVKVERL